MKRTESTDEAVQPNDQVFASGHDTELDETSTMHQRRRRLVRSAAALAPLVLTLRSGALAAASCTGVSQLVTLDANGKFLPAPPTQENDICVTYSVDSCSDNKISSASKLGIVVRTNDPNDPLPFQCTGATGGGQVAILSAHAAQSFGIN